MAASPNLAKLRHLCLGGISTRGIRLLLNSPHLKNLKSFGGVGEIDNRSLRAALQARFGKEFY